MFHVKHFGKVLGRDRTKAGILFYDASQTPPQRDGLGVQGHVLDGPMHRPHLLPAWSAPGKAAMR